MDRHPSRGQRRGTGLVLVAVATLLLAACGGTAEENPGGNATTGSFPAQVEATNGTVTVAARPERIVSLSPTATEILFAIGAGEQVKAVDDQSDFPAEAPTTDLSGFTPNVEAVLALEPDLVVISDDIDGVVAALETASVPVVQQSAAATFDDSYQQIEALGTVTGNQEGAERTVDEMRAGIEAAVSAAGIPEDGDVPLTVYHELDDTLFSATSGTFVGQVYELFGLENIADAADTESSGFPQLSAEYVVTADPNLIFLADTECCGQTPETVAARPGWDRISAVQEDGVVPLDDDIASRWGPRVVELTETVGAAVAERRG